MPRLIMSLLCLACICTAACTRVTVTKDPGVHDKGIRYYRPKPYLMITPAPGAAKSDALFTTKTTVEQKKPLEVKTSRRSLRANGDESQLAGYEEILQADESAGAVAPLPDGEITSAYAESDSPTKVTANLALMYLPDFSEEYSIRLRPGLGIGELNLKLDNGWNLTSVGIKTDQQTDEIISSIGDLIGSLPTGGKAYQRGTPCGQTEVSNIPFGLYEAVIAEDPCGRKQLYGWRYVGFMPFQACPVQSAGMQQVCCNDPYAIYGLVMELSGAMKFKKIAEIDPDRGVPCLVE